MTQLPYGDFKVVMALADDAHGGWTNRFTTDYDSKFKPAAIIKRQFCVPVFWVSEAIDEAAIRQTTRPIVIAWFTSHRAQNLNFG